MGNIIYKNKNNAGLGILILWMFTIGMFIFRFGMELDSYIRQIEYATPKFVELTDEELEERERKREITESFLMEIPIESESSQTSDNQSQDDYSDILEEYNQELAELKKERNFVIAEIAIMVFYLIIGTIAFVRLRNKEKARAIIFAVLALINALIFFMLPEMFVPSNPYNIIYVTNA